MNQEARNKLVEENLGLAVFFAKKFRATRMDLEDLVQEAYLGLIEAAERFDPNYGTKFSTYARWRIVKTIMDAIRTRNEMIRVPRSHKKKDCLSLDGLLNVAGEWLVDPAPPVYELLDEEEKRKAVHDCIRKLSKREGIVVRLRHGVNTEWLTLVSVGQILGVSPERVRQIQQKGEKNLRAIILQCATLGDHGAVIAARLKEAARPEDEKHEHDDRKEE